MLVEHRAGHAAGWTRQVHGGMDSDAFRTGLEEGAGPDIERPDPPFQLFRRQCPVEAAFLAADFGRMGNAVAGLRPSHKPAVCDAVQRGKSAARKAASTG